MCVLPSFMKTSMYRMPVREDFLSSRVPGEVWLVFLGCYVGTHLLICTEGTSPLSISTQQRVTCILTDAT